MQRDTEKKDDSIHETTDDADEVPAVWKDICVRQRDRRLEAERENIRLKKQCKEEMQVVKSIQKVLFKRLVHVSQTEASKRTRRTNLPAGYIKHIAALIFEELSIGSEACLRLGVAMLVAANSITTSTLPHMPLLRGGIRGTERTLFDRISLPFGLHATGGAWWRNWQQYRGHVEEAADTVSESYGLEMNDFTALTSVISYVQQVLRRNVEEFCITLVWNAYIEPFVFKSEQVGIYFLEQCHIVMQPEDVDSGADEDLNATCMSSCYVITPYFLDSALENDPNALSLIDFLIGALFSNMKAFNERVEDLLLDEALQKHNLSTR